MSNKIIIDDRYIVTGKSDKNYIIDDVLLSMSLFESSDKSIFDKSIAVYNVAFPRKIPDSELPVKNIIKSRKTGIKDKNGKEIYEGDIVQYGPIQNNIRQIYFEDAAFLCGGFKFLDMDKNAEIIGNIYENPELLEEKDET